MNATEKYKAHLARMRKNNQACQKRKKNKMSQAEKLWIWDRLHQYNHLGELHSSTVIVNLRKKYKELQNKKKNGTV